MWVLEARKDAEKIWFPIVWETEKDASNIIDYNINEEKTLDNADVTNANNQTTTGMATLIYWVNAPKILEKTSIYQNTAKKSLKDTLVFTHTLERPDDNTWTVREATITKNYWDLELKNREIVWGRWTNWVVFPMSWWYQLEITYPTWSHWAQVTAQITTTIKTAKWYTWDETITTYTNAYVYPHTETIQYYFTKWDAIYVDDELWSEASSVSRWCTTTIVVTLL